MLLIIKGKMVCVISCDDLLLFTTWNDENGNTKYVFQRRRCCAFSVQFTINFGKKKRQSWYKKNVSTPSVLRFLSVIRHESFRYNHAFSKKAQHRWRWISLRTFPRGRLVPRQSRAIKSTTRTELRGEGIYFAKFIHWDNGAIPTQLRDETIVGVTWLIIKGEIV